MSLNRTQILSLVLGRCGRREADTYLLAQAKVELDLIQSRLEGAAFMPWFLLTAESSLATIQNVRAVDIPSDFLREWEDYPLTYYDSTEDDPYRELVKDEFDILQETYQDADAGPPQAYALAGDVLEMFPTPDAVYTLLWRYYARGTALSDSVITNVWTENADDLLVAELGFVMAGTYLQNSARAGVFAAEIAAANARLLAFDEARKQAMRDARRSDLRSRGP